MPTYIMLCNFTAKGIQEVKDSPKRLNRAKALLRKLGGRIRQFYLCLGGHDIVVVAEAPTDEAIARFVLEVASLGYVTTTTLKAFPEPEYRKIMKSLP